MALAAAQFVELDSAWEKGPKKFLDEILDKLRNSDPSIHVKIRDDSVLADIGKIFQGAKDAFSDKGAINHGAYSVMISILGIADEMMSSATPDCETEIKSKIGDILLASLRESIAKSELRKHTQLLRSAIEVICQMVTGHMGNQELLLSNIEEYTKMMIEAIKFSGDFTTQCTAIEILCNLHSLKFNESLEHLVGNGIVYGETEKKMLKLRSKSRKSISDIRKFVMEINDDDSIVSTSKRVWSLRARRIQLNDGDVMVETTPWVDFGAESLSFDKRLSPSKPPAVSNEFMTYVVQYQDIEHMALENARNALKLKLCPKTGVDFGPVQTLFVEFTDEAFLTFTSRTVDRIRTARASEDERTGISAASINLVGGLPITPTTSEERRARKESFKGRVSGTATGVLSEIDKNTTEKRVTRKTRSTGLGLGNEAPRMQATRASKELGQLEKNHCTDEFMVATENDKGNNNAATTQQQGAYINGNGVGHNSSVNEANYSDALSQINGALFVGLQAIEKEIADMEHKTVEFESEMETRCHRLATYRTEAEKLQQRLAETMKKQYNVFAQRREGVLEKGRAVLEKLRREQAFDFNRIDP